MKKNVASFDVSKIAKLANLKMSPDLLQKISPQFSSVLDLVSKIKSLDTEGVVETSQVAGLENVFREDVIDTTRILTQEEALLNAKKSHNGFFMVNAILEE